MMPRYKVFMSENYLCHDIPYKLNIWRTLYLANEGKNRIGEILNWRSTLQQSISACITNDKFQVMANFNLTTEKRYAKSPNQITVNISAYTVYHIAIYVMT